MDRRTFLQSLAAVALPARAAERPMNVVLILADDLGWAELGSYGNRFNRTPNLDRLASEAIRFTDAYSAAPVCSPTRASIVTGQHPARVGILDYLGPADTNHLSPSLPTLPKMLKSAGYVCGLIGKWHLMGDYEKRRGDPKLHGFDEVICSETKYIGGGSYFHPYAHLPEVKARTHHEYLTDRLSQEAADFIGRHRAEPFFLYLAHYSVHTTLAGKPELVHKYRDFPGAGKNRNNPELAAMIESLDNSAGVVRDALRRHGVDRNTVVIFMSDNGGEDRVTSNAPLRAGKSHLYEGGIRVPLIVDWPGRSRAAVCHAPVVSTDLYPTILDIAGVKHPDAPLDGQSISPLVSEPGATTRKEPIFWHYPLDKPHFLGGRSSGAIRSGDDKLIEFFDSGAVELYNLKDDVGETRDLSRSEPRKAAKLLARMRRLRAATKKRLD